MQYIIYCFNELWNFYVLIYKQKVRESEVKSYGNRNKLYIYGNIAKCYKSATIIAELIYAEVDKWNKRSEIDSMKKLSTINDDK